LTETLPVLEQALPALPGKVEAVAHEGDELEKAAREAIGQFGQRQAQAAALLDQVREALQALGDQAGEERQHLEQAVRALNEAAGQEVQGVDDGAETLEAGGDAAEAAFGALEADLRHAAERARAAHEEARSALDGLGDEARSKRSELDEAGADVTEAARSAAEAVQEGEKLVSEGVSTLGTAMSRLVEDVRQRLERTRDRLDRLRSEQEAAVAAALSELDGERGQIEHELTQVVETGLEQPVERELEDVAGALAQTEQQVLGLQAEARARRENIEQEIAAVADQIAPLRGGAQQVRRAADEVGITWP
jgi:DNA repair protein SbcC/Rad50